MAATFPLLRNALTDMPAADQLLANLRNTTHTDYALALANITSRLAAYGLRDNDIDLLAAEVSPASPPPSTLYPASLIVTAKLYLYNPRQVHRAALLDAAAAGTAWTGAGRRRAMECEAGDSGCVHDDDSGAFDWGSHMRKLIASELSGSSVVAQDGDSAFSASRQLLQASSSSTDAQPPATLSSSADILNALASSIATALNASSVTSALSTSPELIPGYIAVIAAATQALANSTVAVANDALALSGRINATMGEQANAVDDAKDAQIHTAYTALLAAFTAAENATTVKAQEVLRLLDAQLALDDQLAASMSDVATQLAELTEATRSQTDRALYDTIAMEEALGINFVMDYTPACFRLAPSGFRASFNISRPATTTQDPATNGTTTGTNNSGSSTRRQLQQAGSRGTGILGGGKAGGDDGSAVGTIPWLGYILTQGSPLVGPDLDVGVTALELLAAGQARYAGARSANRIVGGLLLHTTRRPLPAPVVVEGGQLAPSGTDGVGCGGAFSDLDPQCGRYALEYLRGGEAAAEALRQRFGDLASSVAPYGVDPVFLRCVGRHGVQASAEDAAWVKHSAMFVCLVRPMKRVLSWTATLLVPVQP